MNPDSEESFLKEEGKLAAAAVGFWPLYVAGGIATLVVALWLIKTLWGI
jgi:hypothetical protein